VVELENLRSEDPVYPEGPDNPYGKGQDMQRSVHSSWGPEDLFRRRGVVKVSLLVGSSSFSGMRLDLMTRHGVTLRPVGRYCGGDGGHASIREASQADQIRSEL
jgi:hypothetical protein